MMTWRSMCLAVAAGLLGLCALAPARPEKAEKADVSIDLLPPVIVSAAERAIPGGKLTEAKVRRRKATAFYKLAGVKDGKASDMRVAADGTILKLDQDGKVKAARGKVNFTRIPGQTPARQIGVIEHTNIRESS